MTIRLSQLSAYWGADEAAVVVELLDELRDALWATYGDDIIAIRRAQAQHPNYSDEQLPLQGLDDASDF